MILLLPIYFCPGSVPLCHTQAGDVGQPGETCRGGTAPESSAHVPSCCSQSPMPHSHPKLAGKVRSPKCHMSLLSISTSGSPHAWQSQIIESQNHAFPPLGERCEDMRGCTDMGSSWADSAYYLHQGLNRGSFL